MSGGWNNSWRDHEFRQDSWSHNRDYNVYRQQQQHFGYGNDGPTFSRYSKERFFKARWNNQTANLVSGENNFNSANRMYRGPRNWGRRSASVPRSTSVEEKDKWNTRQNLTYSSTSKTNIPFNTDDKKPESLNKSKNTLVDQDKDTAQVPQLKKFRTIFDGKSNKVPDGPEIVKQSDVSPVLKTNVDKDKINHIVNRIDLKNKEESIVASDGIETTDHAGLKLPTKNRRVFLNPSKNKEEKDLSDFYGESLTELNIDDLKLHHTKLPVVDWPKTSFSVDTIPQYDSSKCVGGEGLTLEVFYLCKYCKMFTGGRQIDSHLKSRYHYDRYKEFLRTGQIAEDSSSSSSESSSDCDSKTSKSSLKQEDKESTAPSAMETDDPSDIVYNCHQELDFD